MWWGPYGSGWQQWNSGTCTNVAAAADGGAYITNDCGTVYRSGERWRYLGEVKTRVVRRLKDMESLDFSTVPEARLTGNAGCLAC